MNKGYIKIWRKSMDNPLYFSEPFTKWQAWIDLLMLANHQNRVIHVRNIPIEVKRGEVLAGENFLAERWQWSRGKIRRYLTYLEKTVQQIVQQKDNVTTVIAISNYEAYNENGTACSTTNDTADGQQTVQQTDTPKNVKKEEELKELIKEYGDISEEYKTTYISNHPDYAKEVEKNYNERAWCKTIDELIRIDSNSREEVREVLFFAIQNSFWHTQVRSLVGIRKRSKNGCSKFDNIKTSMLQEQYKQQQEKEEESNTESFDEALERMRGGKK